MDEVRTTLERDGADPDNLKKRLLAEIISKCMLCRETTGHDHVTAQQAVYRITCSLQNIKSITRYQNFAGNVIEVVSVCIQNA